MLQKLDPHLFYEERIYGHMLWLTTFINVGVGEIVASFAVARQTQKFPPRAKHILSINIAIIVLHLHEHITMLLSPTRKSPS